MSISEKQYWKNELLNYISCTSDENLCWGVSTELINLTAADAGGITIDIFKVTVQDFISTSEAFKEDNSRFLWNPESFWSIPAKECKEMELLGRIIFHFFLAQPVLAWPAALDPLLLLLCVQPTQASLFSSSDFESSISILGELFNGLSTLHDTYGDKPSAPQTPLLDSFVSKLEEWEGRLGSESTERQLTQLIKDLKMHPETANIYAEGKLLFLNIIAVDNRYMLLQSFFKGLNCTKAIDNLCELGGTVRDIYTFALSQTKIKSYDDIIPYIQSTPDSEPQKRSLALLIRWLKSASTVMLQNFASNVTGHSQKLGIKFRIEFKIQAEGQASFQELRPHFHSCLGWVDLYPWTSDLSDVELLEIFDQDCGEFGVGFTMV